MLKGKVTLAEVAGGPGKGSEQLCAIVNVGM